MTARLMLVAAAALGFSVAASADDPVKPNLRDSGPATQRELVLASADVKTPAGVANVQTGAPKKRVARITTCRCGDPQPQSDDDQTSE